MRKVVDRGRVMPYFKILKKDGGKIGKWTVGN
jgi:hypothetical protein